MELVCPPLPVPGGEKIKNELFFVEQMQRACSSTTSTATPS